ncbi:MAG: hypothetical protein AB1489_29000 [Acidobacteriota bacterium]
MLTKRPYILPIMAAILTVWLLMGLVSFGISSLLSNSSCSMACCRGKSQPGSCCRKSAGDNSKSTGHCETDTEAKSVADKPTAVAATDHCATTEATSQQQAKTSKPAEINITTSLEKPCAPGCGAIVLNALLQINKCLTLTLFCLQPRPPTIVSLKKDAPRKSQNSWYLLSSPRAPPIFS